MELHVPQEAYFDEKKNAFNRVDVYSGPKQLPLAKYATNSLFYTV